MKKTFNLLIGLMFLATWAPYQATAQPYPELASNWLMVNSNIDLLWGDDLGFNLDGSNVTAGQYEEFWIDHNSFKDADTGINRASSFCPGSSTWAHGTRGAARIIGQRSGVLEIAAGVAEKAELVGCVDTLNEMLGFEIVSSSFSAGPSLSALDQKRTITLVQAVGNTLKDNTGRTPAANWYKFDLYGTIPTYTTGNQKNVLSVGGAFGIADGVSRPVNQFNLPARYNGNQIPNTWNFFTSQGPTVQPYQGGDANPRLHAKGRIKPDLVITNRADLHTQLTLKAQGGAYCNVEEQTGWVPGVMRNSDPYNEAANLGFVRAPGPCVKTIDHRGGNGLQTANFKNSDPNAISGFTGSSAAAPSAAGVVVLLDDLRQRYSHSEYLSSTMKALLIHSAFEMGPWDGPDYRQGWGMVNAAGAAHLINLGDVTNLNQNQNSDRGLVIEDELLFAGDSDSYTIQHDGTGPLKASIVWFDPQTNVDLVNDLNVEITRVSDGTKYEAWVLDPMNPSAPPTKGHNTTDNVEQVYLTASEATAGNSTVKVFGNGSFTNQSYSLVVTTYDTADPCGPDWNLDNLTYNDPRVYRAPNYITSANTLVDTNNSGDVTYHAGNEVVLEPGFEANDNFEAGIRQCVIPSGYAFKASGNYAQQVTPTIQDADITASFSFGLEPNYPNPFTDVTTISYSLAESDQVKLELFDMTGRLIKVIENDYKEAGKYTQQLELGSLPSGSYIYSLRTGDQVAHRSMTIIK